MAVSETRTLDTIALLAEVPAATREAVARQCRWHHYAAHEQIIDRDDEGRDVYFLVAGRVRVVIYSASGREITFDDLRPGAVFGELSAIDGQPRSANVIALTDCTVAILAPGIFQRVMSETPALAIAATKLLARMVRRATERIMDLSTIGANNRVHGEILRLARETQKDDNTAIIAPIPLHHDIAGRVSTTRETVARVMSDLARAGLVERQADHLLVRDFARLEELVEDVRGES